MSKLYPCKETITETEHLQLLGLLTLAARHNIMLKSIANAVKDIIGAGENDGHCFDAVYGDYTVEELLEKMEVKVKANADNG